MEKAKKKEQLPLSDFGKWNKPGITDEEKKESFAALTKRCVTGVKRVGRNGRKRRSMKALFTRYAPLRRSARQRKNAARGKPINKPIAVDDTAKKGA